VTFTGFTADDTKATDPPNAVGIRRGLLAALTEPVLAIGLAVAALPPLVTPCLADVPASRDEAQERRRIHSRAHAEQRLPERLTPGSGRSRIVDPIVDPVTVPWPDEAIRKLRCRAAAVVTGTITGSAGVVSEDEDLVYTDYHVEVDEVLAGRDRRIAAGQLIELTRPGGTTVWKGRTTFVRLNEYPELVVGERYVFFVGAPLESGAFTTVGADGVFRLAAGGAEPLGPWIVKGAPPEDLLGFIRRDERCRPQDRDRSNGFRPMTRLDDPGPADPVARDVRAARDQRYERLLPPLANHDGDEFLVRGIEEVASPLPVAESDLVAIGRVVSARAVVTEDRRGIYSEFPFEVESPVKGSPPSGSARTLTLIRFGGAVRHPSGRITRVFAVDQGMPRPGGRYLVFLKHDPSAQAFRILTVYLLQDGRVHPLDSSPAFDAYDGLAEADLLAALR
jgi:hypothetical protein